MTRCLHPALLQFLMRAIHTVSQNKTFLAQVSAAKSIFSRQPGKGPRQPPSLSTGAHPPPPLPVFFSPPSVPSICLFKGSIWTMFNFFFLSRCGNGLNTTGTYKSKFPGTPSPGSWRTCKDLEVVLVFKGFENGGRGGGYAPMWVILLSNRLLAELATHL